ncbi:amino acid ABC transporter permease, partial [Geobacillus sp. MMMUD3]|nr:amino acid ABC transporter permease [Geobacillus sp. MMMUD3]
MSKRQKAKLSRGIQYAILIVIAIVIAFTADWPTLIETFGRVDIAMGMFPQVLNALKNTIVFTVLGFALGLAIALVVALMRLSSVGVYRWLATIYIEFFRGLPALVVFLVMGFGLPVAFQGFILPQLVIIMI